MNPNQNHFSSQPTAVMTKRSTFNRPKSHLFTGNVGDLIPVSIDECLPGDTVTVNTAKVARLQTLLAPIFDEIFLDTYWFFVPWRLCWNHTREFFGENRSTYWEQPTEYHIPQIKVPSSGWSKGTLADYFGLPIGDCWNAGDTINAMPFRAYCRVFNDWFRDENVQQPLYLNTDDTTVQGSNSSDPILGPQAGGYPAKANKIHDRYTSCLPAPQKGSDVPIGFGSVLPVELFNDYTIGNIGDSYNTEKRDGSIHFLKTDVNSKLAELSTGSYSAGVKDGDLHLSSSSSSTAYSNNHLIPANMGVSLDNSNYSINTLRTAFAVQRYLEKLARGGSRYIEYIKTMFGVTSPDARLQRTEYLGGSRMVLDINQVQSSANTTNENVLTRLGDVAANSVTGEYHSDFTKSFTEHGYLICLCTARYKHKYQNGVEKLWRRKDVYSVYNPTFANVGEQPVYTEEIYTSKDMPKDRVFGYNEAWSEYRVARDFVSGEFNSRYGQPLDSWHLADNYSSVPTLSAEWMREDKSNVDRVIATTSTLANQMLFDYYIDAKWTRVMPLYSVPGLIDHM